MAKQGGAGPLDVARQAELLELTQDAILLRDPASSAVTYWNRGAERLYGWSRDEARGRVTHDLLHTRFPSSREAVDEELFAGNGFWEGELVHRAKDGREVVVASRQAVQRDQHGTPIAILEINTDITARRQAEHERIRRLAEQHGRELTERALERLSRLHRVRSALAETLTSEQVARLVLTEAVAAVGANGGSVTLSDDILVALGEQDQRTGATEDVPLIVDGRRIGLIQLHFATSPALDGDD
ncbi:MAG TPA: PAS domain S-box protein, partial [Chloroflexota bacterium]|nr:PAS domain S-box protein [Chloroflexota bacterium]